MFEEIYQESDTTRHCGWFSQYKSTPCTSKLVRALGETHIGRNNSHALNISKSISLNLVCVDGIENQITRQKGRIMNQSDHSILVFKIPGLGDAEII